MALTLTIDIGGGSTKSALVDSRGDLVGPLFTHRTPLNCPPESIVEHVHRVLDQQTSADRLSVGFPGIVRRGLVIDAWNVIRDGDVVGPALEQAWNRFQLGQALADRCGRPVILVNDADLHAAGVIEGVGLEVLLTLGTGVGFSQAYEGVLLPHVDLAFHVLADKQTYHELLGDTGRRTVGLVAWRERVETTLALLERVLRFDRLYVGGGNARYLDGVQWPRVSLVDSTTAPRGGAVVWEAGRLPTETFVPLR